MQHAKNLSNNIAQALCDKKGEDIQIIHTTDLTVLADYFVVASGQSSVQVKALADAVEETIEQLEQERPIRKEGYEQGRWIVLDYGDVLVHIFHRQEREFYNIERLWDDGKNIVHFECENETAS